MSLDLGGMPTGHLLIVDDERDNRELLEILLNRDGFLTVTAASGEEALASVARQRPDLILLDIMMPLMDGYAVAGALHGDPATCDIPVVMITALDDYVCRERALLAGAADVLHKPVHRGELSRRVRALLGERLLNGSARCD